MICYIGGLELTISTVEKNVASGIYCGFLFIRSFPFLADHTYERLSDVLTSFTSGPRGD